MDRRGVWPSRFFQGCHQSTAFGVYLLSLPTGKGAHVSKTADKSWLESSFLWSSF